MLRVNRSMKWTAWASRSPSVNIEKLYLNLNRAHFIGKSSTEWRQMVMQTTWKQMQIVFTHSINYTTRQNASINSGLLIYFEKSYSITLQCVLRKSFISQFCTQWENRYWMTLKWISNTTLSTGNNGESTVNECVLHTPLYSESETMSGRWKLKFCGEQWPLDVFDGLKNDCSICSRA